LGSLVVALSCRGGNDHTSPPPIDSTIGGLKVHLEIDPLRLVVTSPDGRVLWDGLAPHDVAAPTDASDPPPLTGFAARTVSSTAKELYGSYLITDVDGTWRVGRRAQQVAADGSAFDVADDAGTFAHVTLRATPSIDRAITVDVRPTVDVPSGARAWASIGAACEADDRFLGFGGEQRDVEYHGSVVPMFTSEPGIGKSDDDVQDPGVFFVVGTRHATSYPAPVFLSNRGFVGALGNRTRSTFGVCGESLDDGTAVLRVTTAAQAIDDPSSLVERFEIFDGPSPKEALQRSTAAFGRPRRPPDLAFAPWNDAIFGSASVRAFAQKLRTSDIPSSLIWTEDWRGGEFVGDDYKLKERWGVDRTLYPDFETLAGDLHGMGYSFLVYFNTFVEQGSDVWDEATSKGFLVKHDDGSDYIFTDAKQNPAGLVDLTNTDAAAWTTQKLKDAIALGADGWMGDYGEWMPVDAKVPSGDAWVVHDDYPMLWQQTQRAALDDTPNDKRISFVRSGWLGDTTLEDVVWGGDQRTDMEPDDGFPTVVAMGLGLGIAGVSTYGHDIGGYQSATNEPTSKETYFRWMELGAWTPVMRTHHGTQPKKEWHLDSDDETLQAYRRLAIQHMQLLPTWGALADEAHANGTPIWRHLALEFSGDSHAWDVGDELMIGSSILVAPVMTKGATSRDVYFPAGTWFPWDASSGPVAGGQTTSVAAALDFIPVFVRGGSIVVELPDTVRGVLPATGVVSASDVGDDRVLIVAAGADTQVVEGASTYDMKGASALALPTTAPPQWNGTALNACDATKTAPCIESSAGRSIAHVVGTGSLTLDGATVDVSGGATTRKTTIDVRANARS
jgi:alpha-glucosidase (family GH31 glycosyl hydrolase)